MTVNDLYKLTKAWMFEKNTSTIYDNYILPITNKVLAEVAEENNMARMFRGLRPLESIPQVTSLNDDLTDMGIMEEYQLEVIPKGVDANFLMDDDLNKMSLYQTEYNNARVKCQKMVSQERIEEILNAI